MCSPNASLFKTKMFYYYVALKVYHILQINICSWQCYLRQQPNLSTGLNPTERSTNDQKVLNKQQKYYVKLFYFYYYPLHIGKWLQDYRYGQTLILYLWSLPHGNIFSSASLNLFPRQKVNWLTGISTTEFSREVLS